MAFIKPSSRPTVFRLARADTPRQWKLRPANGTRPTKKPYIGGIPPKIQEYHTRRGDVCQPVRHKTPCGGAHAYIRNNISYNLHDIWRRTKAKNAESQKGSCLYGHDCFSEEPVPAWFCAGVSTCCPPARPCWQDAFLFPLRNLQ